MRQFNVMDLFSGVGGLSYGFSKSKFFNILIANEIEKDISIAYTLNHPSVEMLNCDIGDITKEELAKKLKGRKIDIIVGGPPCQSYSTLGKRQMDKRASLFLQYKRILELVNPTAFVFENVVGIISMNRGKLFNDVQTEFSKLGYQLKYKVLDAADYGVPQHRERVILVGFKGQNPFNYPTPTHGINNHPYVTLKEAIGDLPVLRSGEESKEYMHEPNNEFLQFVREESGSTLTEHKAPKNGKSLIKIMNALKDGESKMDLPEDIRPKSGYGNTYAKLWWERPSTTITRNFACPSSSRCIHPRDSRAMTIREGARLQSFPDSYKFYGTDSMKRLEIGNAVPPLLSIALANQMINALDSYCRTAI